jgi:hypothetical protein
MDSEAIRQFAEENIITCLQFRRESLAATNIRKQHYHACNILHVQHHPAVLFSMIGRLFKVCKATFCWHQK